MRSGGVPGEDFDMENSILTVPGANFRFQSAKTRNYEIYKKYKLEDAVQAHKDLESRLLTGPAVIVP